jgi:hypothetical protein
MAGVSFFMLIDALAELANPSPWYLPLCMFLLTLFGCLSILFDRGHTES